MLFLSTYHNRIDKKGRVSVPAPFRAALAAQEFAGIVAYVSPLHACIEACGMNRIAKLNSRIEKFDPYSEERDAFATTIFGESVQLGFDTEGRVMLPAGLLAAAALKEHATIVGKGEIFEIWEPKAFEVHAKRARGLVREKRFQLRGDA
ncbi:MAG: cell division/cell wall cluster transcriptional repressor MraZ [Pseudomonadota bacterium]|nr:cell division/cell wall cluster transcriptional repressor MraZ [Pseudomonadota bacterium]MDE3037439.1 cell division/cell wall cluster transcriptional repressor MraZ [Pseudomonadota bacterium]